MTAGPAPVKRLYRPDEVAKLLNIGLRTVYRHVESGHIPGLRIGKLIRIPVEAFHRQYP